MMKRLLSALRPRCARCGAKILLFRPCILCAFDRLR